jgi:hypothetical protein
MATFYFNGQADLVADVSRDWQTLGNWWMDSAHTVAASALPTSSDSVIASASIQTNSGSEPTLVNLTLDADSFANLALQVPVTITGIATFKNSENASTITGNAAFVGIDGRLAVNSGEVTGNATFSGAGVHNGVVGGNATFGGDTWTGNSSAVNGTATFNDTSYNTGTVTGVATFNDTSYNNGEVGVGSIFNDYSHNQRTVSGMPNPTFNDYSYNNGEADFYGTATFNDYSECRGYYGTAQFTTFNHNSRNVSGTTYNRTVTFNDASYGICWDGGGTVTINGRPIRATEFTLSSYAAVSFTRAELGINGSSILGVV